MGSAGTATAAGFVLAGGASRRMGSNKALLPCSRTTLVEYVANQVRAAAGSARVVGRRELLPELRLEVLEDMFPGEGPLGGIITVLRNSNADWNLIVACDMPAVVSASLRGLLESARMRDCDALVPTSGDGWKHPLCAVYRRTALTGLKTAWSAGTRGVIRALDFIRTEYIEFGDSAQLTNVNTPEDWNAVRNTLN